MIESFKILARFKDSTTKGRREKHIFAEPESPPVSDVHMRHHFDTCICGKLGEPNSVKAANSIKIIHI